MLKSRSRGARQCFLLSKMEDTLGESAMTPCLTPVFTFSPRSAMPSLSPALPSGLSMTSSARTGHHSCPLRYRSGQIATTSAASTASSSPGFLAHTPEHLLDAYQGSFPCGLSLTNDGEFSPALQGSPGIQASSTCVRDECIQTCHCGFSPFQRLPLHVTDVVQIICEAVIKAVHSTCIVALLRCPSQVLAEMRQVLAKGSIV